MIRATDDVERVRMFIAQGLIMAAQAFLLLAGALIILALTNWRLTLVVLPLLPMALVLFMYFGRVSQPLFRLVQIKLSALNTILQENMAGLKVVKAFTREPYEAQRFDSAATALMAQQLHVSRVFSFLFPLIFLIAQLGQAAVLYFGARQILGGTLNLGEYQKFSLYLVYVFFPLGQLGFIIALMSQASTSAGRIFEILDAQSDIVEKPGALALPAIRGRVEFRGCDLPLLRQQRAGAQPRQLHGRAGPDGGVAGRHRQRQEHDHQPDPALLRRQRGPDPDRRPRSARPDDRQPALADRHRAPGDQPVQRHDPRQHRLWPLRRDA